MSGAIADTTEDNFSAPGSRPGVATSAGDNEFHVLRLATFLRENFPHQVGRTDGVSTEHPVDVAMRLLQGLTSSQPAGERCHDQYCNKPVGHSDDHGWVEYTQS